MIDQATINEHLKVLPTKIFKYFEYGDNLKNTLSEKYFWYSNPKDFNDPFDCNISLMKAPSFMVAQNFLKSDDSLSRRERRKIDKKPKETIESITRGFQQQLNNYGICCFSAKENDPLMWAHYAKKHSGVMLTINPHIDKEHLMVSKVNYQEEYCPEEYAENFSMALFNFTLIKHKAWEYEEEFRSFRLESGKHYFNSKAIESITLGLNFDKKNLNELRSILNEHYPNIELYKSVFVKEKIKIIQEKI